MGVTPGQVDGPTIQAGAEAGVAVLRWNGGRPPLGTPFYELICKMTPKVEKSWLKLASLWAIGFGHRYRPMGMIPEQADGPPAQTG